MRFAQRVGLSAGAVAAVLGLAGCGTSNGSLLTPAAATQLTAELNQVTTALDQLNCQPAYQAVTNFSDDVNQLVGVNPTLVKMLSEGASRIATLANERCPSGVSPSTTTTSSSTATTATGTTTTSTSVTTTSPVTTTTSDTSTNSGGAAPTTLSTPTVPTTPPVTTSTGPTTTPDSGGAGLNGSSGNPGSGAGGADGQ